MTVIRISEQSREADGSFGVRVAFGEQAGYGSWVTDPAGPDTEKLLAWYFEQHLRFPFLDLDREHQATAELAEYGQKLFAQVLGGDANHSYRTLRGRSFDDCRLEVEGSAAFHLLHWEALRDPDMDTPLAVRLPFSRRVAQLEQMFELAPERSTLNILVVTARPFGAGDVGYRTISRPLLDGVRQSNLPVTVDLVRPGTWEALREHLQSVTEKHQSGWYQVIHFDLHGGFNEFADLDQLRQQGRMLFQAAPIQPYAGKRPFLFFETAQEGKAGPVPAAAVASLLAEHRIPVAVLNACQSAMQAGSEASLALQLVQAGVPAAVGMAYSVTVSAAVQAMAVLYGRLTQGADPVAALHAARRSLYHKRGRQAYFDQQLDLEDWVLPVGFRQQPLQLRLASMDDADLARFLQHQADVGDEPTTEYGFVGRDLDIQVIERRLLTSRDANELLVQGMAGAGKSTLLRHLAWWWQRTGLIEEVFAFSYEDRAWTCSQIIREIRSKLFTKVDQARADTMTDAAQLEQIAQLLRARRHLLILDNAESITATPAAIPHALDPGEQAQIKTLLSRLRGGNTLVVIGSREAEAWLAPRSFGANIYPLPGLDPQAVSTLLERILRTHGALRWLQDTAERDALQNLVELLGSYPLPMTVVLPVLATHPPSAVLAELKAGGTGPDPAGQITRAVEYSHGKLNPALQNSLLLLAPFTAVIPSPQMLDEYRSFLLSDETIQALGSIDLVGAVAEAVKVGLASPHAQLRGWVQVQPVLPYFLRSRLQQHRHLREATSQAHYQLYARLGPQLHQLLISPGKPDQRVTGQTATGAEYANLTAALTHGLKTSQSIRALIRPLEEYLDQAQQHAARGKLLDDTIASYPEPVTQAQQSELAVLHGLAGIAATEQRRFDNAKAHHETELRLNEATNDKLNQGIAYVNLGNIAAAQRRFEEAEANYRQALDIFLEFGGRHGAADTYGQLGSVAMAQRRFEEAEANHRQALDIFLESGDRHSAAKTYHLLGSVAEAQQRFEEAEANYRQALDIFLEFGDRHSAAVTYGQLGSVDRAQQRFEEAEANHRRGLDLKLESGDRHGAAVTYGQLGSVAAAQRRYGEAEANYRRALDIFLEFNDQHNAAHTYGQLGSVDQAQQRFEEAEANYGRALDIFLEFDDWHGAAVIYHQLGIVAEAQGRFEEAETNYREALDIFLETDKRMASAGASSLGRLLATRSRHAEATEILLDAAVSWHQLTGDWDSVDLQWLKRERQHLGDTAFTPPLTAHVPQDLQKSLISAIDNSGEPESEA
jgi:tetratricopeptide (TPR) repeat protein